MRFSKMPSNITLPLVFKITILRVMGYFGQLILILILTLPFFSKIERFDAKTR